MHFYDSLNIMLILDLGCEFLCAKCVQFPLMIKLIKNKVSKIIEVVYYFVNEKKYCQICTCPV